MYAIYTSHIRGRELIFLIIGVAIFDVDDILFAIFQNTGVFTYPKDRCP